MTPQKLTRTNKRPLAFTGELIHEDDTKTHNSTRWQKLAVYRAEAGNIVVALRSITCWQWEHDHHSAEICDNLETAMTYIEEHAPDLASDAAAKLEVSEHL